jgi:hypothetical protein
MVWESTLRVNLGKDVDNRGLNPRRTAMQICVITSPPTHTHNRVGGKPGKEYELELKSILQNHWMQLPWDIKVVIFLRHNYSHVNTSSLSCEI